MTLKSIITAVVLGFSACAALQSCSDNETGNDDFTMKHHGYEPVEPLKTTSEVKLTDSEISALGNFQEWSYRINAEFAKKFMPSLTDGNYCISPLSIAMCMNIIAASVDAPERDMIAQKLGMEDYETMSAVLETLQRYLPDPSLGVTMSIANSIWHDKRFTVAESFKDLMANRYAATVTPLDFSSPEALSILNGWCSDYTQGKIKELFKAMPGNDFTWINAVYFAGKWFYEFYSKDNSVMTFHGRDRDSEVTMMNRSEILDYFENEDGFYLRKPFKGRKYALEIICGLDDEDLNELSEFYKTALDGVMHRKTDYEVNLTIPRFTLDGNYELNRIMSTIGVPETAMHLGPMGLPGYSQAISQFVHGTHIEVDNQGAKMAAATGAGGVGAPPVCRIKKTVDRPFTFILRNIRTEAIIMIGRVNNL